MESGGNNNLPYYRQFSNRGKSDSNNKKSKSKNKKSNSDNKKSNKYRYISFDGKKISIEKRALQNAGPIIEEMFDQSYENEELFSKDNEYFRYIQSIIVLLETGELSSDLLSIDRKELVSIFDYYGVPFRMLSTDYNNTYLSDMIYSQWYRLRRSQTGYAENWKQSLEIFNEGDIEKSRATHTIRKQSISKRLDKDAVIMKTRCNRYIKNEIENEFESFSRNILTKAHHRVDTKISMNFGKETSSTVLGRTIITSLFCNIPLLSPIEDYSVENLKLSATIIRPYFNELASKIHSACSLAVKKRLEVIKSLKEELIESLHSWIFDGTIVAAGGVVVDFISKTSTNTDIDLFVIGLTPEQANNRVKEICELAKNRIQGDTIVASNGVAANFRTMFLRSEASISIVTNRQYYRQHRSLYVGEIKVQFILRIYNDIEEVLMGFDIDASSFGYDGRDILCTKAARRSVRNRVIVLFLERQGTNTVYRCCKYSKQKYFSVYVPDLDHKDAYEAKDINTREGFPVLCRWFFDDIYPPFSSDYEKTEQYSDSEEDNIETKTVNVKGQVSIYAYKDGKFVSKTVNDDMVLQYVNGSLLSLSYNDLMEAIPDIFDNASGEVVWRKTKPGEQTTGTFNKLIVTNPSLWYKPVVEEPTETSVKSILEGIRNLYRHEDEEEMIDTNNNDSEDSEIDRTDDDDSNSEDSENDDAARVARTRARVARTRQQALINANYESSSDSNSDSD